MAITQFKLGSEASCTDGVCGVLVRILLDPRARTVTNLMVEPRGRCRARTVGPSSALSMSIGRQGVSCSSGVTLLRSRNSNGLTMWGWNPIWAWASSAWRRHDLSAGSCRGDSPPR